MFVYHNAGLGGFGSSSYIDSVILVDQDYNSGHLAGGVGDGVLERRLFPMQNWRADVVAIVNSSGSRLESIRYSAYGVPTLLPMADYDANGVVNDTDLDTFIENWDDSVTDTDVDYNGVINSADLTVFTDAWETSEGLAGFNTTSRLAVRKGYAGYENDGVITRFSHVRNRVYDNELARWTRRDPIGYVEGMSLYGYVNSSPLFYTDPDGLISWACVRKALTMAGTCTLCLGALGTCITAPGPHCVGTFAACCL